ncbi:MAG: hypothetical protein Phog2KO_25570 [Phototrophicaceae bacterium]
MAKISLLYQWDLTTQYSNLEGLLRGLVSTAIKISCSKLAFDTGLIANPPGNKPDIVAMAKDSSNLVGWWFSSNMREKETKKKLDINFAQQEVEWQIKYTIDYLSEEVGK